MIVADVMQTDVRTIRETDTIADAVVALADTHVTGLPVLDGRGRFVGVLSTTDILEAEAEAADAAARERLFEDTTVRELMTPRPITISRDATLREAAQVLLYGGVHRVFVTEGDDLVGVVSQTDIVAAVAARRV